MPRRAFLIGGALVAPALLAAAVALGDLGFHTGSRVWVEGSSTARGYRCESTQVQGSAAATTIDLSALRSVPRAEITIPVSTLDCRNGTMNGHMRNALKAQQHPAIRFQASSVTLSPGASGSAVRMAGNLTIAGVTRPATVEGTAVNEAGQLRLRGTHSFSMRDFDVTPPTLMMGTMRVHAPVTVGFDVVLRP
jgi:polyisoprenoid-binding protein YceI